MLLIDRRAGSAELAPVIQALRLPCRLDELPAGDVQFDGNGPKGPCMVGVELKSVRDLLGSMRSGRLVGEQLPKMFEHFDFSYLVVQGVTRANPVNGVLEEEITNSKGRPFWRDVRLGNWGCMWQDMDHYLTTLEHSRLKVRRTDNLTQTAYAVASLYTWYRNKEWHQHQSLKQLFSAPYPYMSLDDKDDVVRRVAKELRGIGPDRSLAVSMRFRSIWAMVHAEVKEWMNIPGVGKTTATRVWREIRGQDGEQPDTAQGQTDNG